MTDRGVQVPEMLVAKFPWIGDNTFLVAEVDPQTGRQVLRMQRVDRSSGVILDEDGIYCIHIAVCTIVPEDYGEAVDTDELARDTLAIRSSEHLMEIHLTTEEKFKAFSSWVAVIAEAGPAAFRIQAEIEEYANLMYPISTPLLCFAARADPSYLPEYFETITRECLHEGRRHFPSLFANLLPLIDAMDREGAALPGSAETIALILDFVDTYPNPRDPQFMQFCRDVGDALRHAVDSRALRQFAATGEAGHPVANSEVIQILFQKSPIAKPMDPKAWNRWGNTLIASHDMARAQDAFEMAVTLDPANTMYRENLATILYTQQKYGEVMVVLTEIEPFRPQSLQSWVRLGSAQYRSGDLTGALRTAKQCLALHPNFASMWYWFGTLNWCIAALNKAISCFERAAVLGDERAAKRLPEARFARREKNLKKKAQERIQIEMSSPFSDKDSKSLRLPINPRKFLKEKIIDRILIETRSPFVESKLSKSKDAT